MYDRSQLGYLIRKIKRTYKWYTGEREDGSATILDLANLFKLPIDDKNLEDYEVKSIEFKEPKIEIISKSTGCRYYAEYSSFSDLLSYGSSGEPKFINQVINYSDSLKREITRSILWDAVYCDRFSIAINDHQTLTLNRSEPNPYSMFSSEFPKTSIYLFDTESQQIGFIDHSIRSSKADAYEFEMETRLWNRDWQYKLSDGIICGFENNTDVILLGLFAENVFEGIKDYFLPSYHFESVLNIENKTLNNDKVYSVITFYASNARYIHIFKENKNFKVKYSRIKSWDDIEEEKFEYLIPVLNESCNIDYTECDYLINELKKYINDEELMKAVCDKLAEIKFRLMVSKGITNKEETVLSIEKYVELSFDDAIKLFVENKDEIFKEILKRIGKTNE